MGCVLSAIRNKFISQISPEIHVTSVGLGRRHLTVQTSLWTRAHPKALSSPLRPPELSNLNRVRFLGALSICGIAGIVQDRRSLVLVNYAIEVVYIAAHYLRCIRTCFRFQFHNRVRKACK